jgi:hypothetical protein
MTQRDVASTEEAVRARALDHLRAARASVERVIATSARTIAAFPGSATSAQQRIIDGEQELAVLDADIATLEAGGRLDDVMPPEDRLNRAHTILAEAQHHIDNLNQRRV